ncbi:MAG: class I SAM-dependent methyltransferase [Anaerolinea sp.]|nr:class I SAM-dependent methyltransferase [Anaerolinea sp.]
MYQPPDRIRREFDAIAPFSGDEWNHNNHYHGYLLSHVPTRIESALDIGCGTGEFARLLAARAERVTGIDLSPEMIRIARERSSGQPNITYQVADVLEWELPTSSYDCIASVATLHHMALDAVLPKLTRALKPGGVLLVLDLYQSEGIGDLLRSALAILLHQYYARQHPRPAAKPEAERQAWDAHGSGDVYPRVSAVRRLAATLLPGAQVRKHVLWRYSLVWTKPVR